MSAAEDTGETKDPDRPEGAADLVPARGPTRYDLCGMPDDQFELLCYRLVRLEYPKVEKPTESSDGGVDALLPAPGGGYERGWQSKHFPKAIGWEKCKKSFADATKNFSPAHYTFCFPRNLTQTEQKTFDRHFRAEGTPIPVDYWNGDEIQARLTDSPEGRTVAAHFFKDDGETLEEIKRAVQAKGSLDTPSDALQRMKPVGEYLATGDPYFDYAGSTYGPGAETKPPEGTVLSLSESENRVTSRIDVVPKDPEAMELHAPKVTMTLPVEVYQEAEKALERGEDFTAEGVDITWEQLPPALSDQVGQPQRADVTIGPAQRRPPAPWAARISAEHGEERAQIDVDLDPVDPPEGWDGAVEGSQAGLTVRILNRRVGDGGQAHFSYSYTLSRAPACEQLEALRLMDLFVKPGGTMRITDRKIPDREATLDTGANEDTEPLDALKTFLGWIVEIEDWAGASIEVAPGDFTQENFEAVAQIAAAVRREGFDIVVGEIELVEAADVPPEIPRKGPVVIRRQIGAEILGQTVQLGTGQIVLEDFKISVRGENELGKRILVLTPPDSEAGKTIEKLSKPEKSKKPPPPPPPRKRHRSRGRGRRKGGR